MDERVARYLDHVRFEKRLAERTTTLYALDLQELTELAHAAMGCQGVSRSDFRYDDVKDELVFLEVNTQPGMTPTSLVPEQAAYVGMSYQDLVRWIVEDASCPR